VVGVVNPSFEGIAALRPDALVGVQGPVDRGVLDRVSALGVRVLFPRVESIEELLGAVETFAALVGREPAGRDLRAALRRELDTVSARVAGRRRPRVIAVFNVQPLVVAGRGSWVDEVLTAAGGENAIATAVRYPTVSVEVVLQAAPEVIFDMTLQMGGGDLRAALSAHGSPRAVTPARVVVLSDPLFVRPGPRVGEAVRRLAAVLHPEAVQ
jgi:iron complex transport system substrate-binding protein